MILAFDPICHEIYNEEDIRRDVELLEELRATIQRHSKHAIALATIDRRLAELREMLEGDKVAGCTPSR